MSRCGRVGDDDWVDAAVALSRHEQIPLVATNDVRFLAQDDFETHEARVCIAQGRVLNDPKRPRDYSDQQYLKSRSEEHTSELQSLMRISYAVFCLKKKTIISNKTET